MQLTTPHDRAIHARRYPDEVKRAAVARVASGESIRAVSRSIGCGYDVLKRWTTNGNPNIASPCPRCAELAAILKLVVETAHASPTIRAGVLRIAADAIVPATATPAASEGQL